jgi:hypothetical protein
MQRRLQSGQVITARLPVLQGRGDFVQESQEITVDFKQPPAVRLAESN